MPPAQPRPSDDRPLLPAAPEWPEAFGTARHKPPGYEAFGRAEPPKDAAPPRDRPDPRDKNAEDAQTQRQPAARRRPSPAELPAKKKPPDDERGRQDDDDQHDGEPDAENPPDDKKDKPDEKPAKPPVYKRPAVLITGAVILLVIIAVALAWWLYARHYESTDDAYIESHVTVISPQVSAPVKLLHVEDNQLVHKGDLLIELDPTDFEVALQQAAGAVAAAEGRLSQAQAQIGAASAAYDEASAEVDAARVQLENTTRDLKRYQDIDQRARSQQQLDTASTTQKAAQAQLAQVEAKRQSAKANIATTQAAVKAADGDLERSKADQRRAQVNLGYCKIFAPSDGRVTLRTIEPGAYAAAGQALFSLVSPDVWVIANFKETQLKLMRPGQSVSIKIDAFSREFTGKVDSIQAGSGSRFSLLPPENATGNFVKIVQRVPVKIVFDHGQNTDDGRLLSPGLSVVPKVKVR